MIHWSGVRKRLGERERLIRKRMCNLSVSDVVYI